MVIRPLHTFGALAVLAVLSISISGCTQKRSTANWQHPTLAKEEWAQDIGDCRRHARREMELQAGIPASGPVADNLPGGTSSYNSTMNRYELSRFQQRTFDSCMRRLGYVPISK